MRVISGLRRGHKLKAPKGEDVRPTEDRVKESLFNILGKIDEEATVLDGFAGSGSIGIEFLSRGAKFAYFVDNSAESVKAIIDNLKHTKFEEKAIIHRKNIFRIIRDLGRNGVKLDYIYLDPPYRKLNLINDVLKEISKAEILKDEGLIIVEHERELELNDKIYNYNKTDFRTYGSKSITFYKHT